MPSNNPLTSNVFLEMNTSLLSPAIVNCDIDTKNFARIINIQLIDNCIFVKGILKKIICYKTLDIHSNPIEYSLFNESEFNTIFELDKSLLDSVKFIPIDAINFNITTLDNYLSGISEYHRCPSTLVAFNLTEDVLITLSLAVELFSSTLPSDSLLIDDFYPQLGEFVNKALTIPLKGPISNCSLSNLNIKRFFIVNVSKVFAEGILYDCCILYSFFNSQEELLCSEKVNFNYISNNYLINSLDEYSVIGSDIISVLDQSISNNVLSETLSLKFISQRSN